jgi:hypothetical protein
LSGHPETPRLRRLYAPALGGVKMAEGAAH